MANPKICPFMSNGNVLLNCSRECKLNTDSPLHECVFEIIAKTLLVIDNGVSDIQETLRWTGLSEED